MGHLPVNGRRLPVFLILVCLTPTVFGVMLVTDVLVHGPYTLKLAPDVIDRLPLALHALGGVGFLTLGAVQLLPGTRARHRRFHQKLGKPTAVFGLIGASSGLWLTLAHPIISGPLLYWGRIGASLFWIAALGLSILAIQRRDFTRHGVWMVRAYAIAMPAGTLAFVLLPFVLIFGENGNDHLFETLQTLAWPLHLLIAEAVIRRRSTRAATVEAR